MDIKINFFRGPETLAWVDFIARLRISEFKKFPYLYSGDMDNEKKYLSAYARSDRSLFAIAFADNDIAGIMTGIPLLESADVLPADAIPLFEKNQLNPEDFYYWGELIIVPEFRRSGISATLFNEANHAIESNYKNICFMAIDREQNHPLRPKNYWDTAQLWKKLGFIQTAMKITIKWPTNLADQQIATDNTLSFWIKELNPG
jgi:hypothetical protein